MLNRRGTIKPWRNKVKWTTAISITISNPVEWGWGVSRQRSEFKQHSWGGNETQVLSAPLISFRLSPRFQKCFWGIKRQISQTEKLSFLFVLLTKTLEVKTKYNFLKNAEMHVFFLKAAFEISTTVINTECYIPKLTQMNGTERDNATKLLHKCLHANSKLGKKSFPFH